MEPPPPPLRPASSSPERAGPSALGDVGRCLGVEHLDKADEDDVTDAADAPRKGQRLEEAAIVELPGKGRDNRFVPIKDVKGMLQTGHFEGVKIAYCTKKDKSCLLSGVIHGTSYFCTCSNCDQKGKARSARGFEQHALKGRHETNNPNDHIIFSSSNLSLFEACHRLKGVKSKEIEEDVFENIKKAIGTGHEDERAYTGNGERAGTGNEEEKVDPILKRLELIEKRLELLENMQSQVTALEKSVDCIVGEMVRYQKLFGELSETLGKFGNI